MFALSMGVLAGVLHVLGGADHTVAVAPLAIQAPHRSAALGVSWGLGHAGGTLGWLVVAWISRSRFELQRTSELAEILVGVSLIALSASVLRKPSRPHAHKSPQLKTALGFGLLHGTAGAGHFLSALPTLGLSSADASLYMAGYLLASIITMMTVSGVTGALSGLGSALRWWRYGSALAAFAIGCMWLARFAS